MEQNKLYGISINTVQTYEYINLTTIKKCLQIFKLVAILFLTLYNNYY